MRRRTRVAQRKWQREHPLPHGHLGQQAIDEMRGGVGHPATAARRAEAAALAREGDPAIESAAVAVHAHESGREDRAPQEAAKLPCHEAGNRLLARGRAGQESLELLLHDLVKVARFGLAARVAPSARDVRIAKYTGGRGRCGAHTCAELPASCRARGPVCTPSARRHAGRARVHVSCVIPHSRGTALRSPPLQGCRASECPCPEAELSRPATAAASGAEVARRVLAERVESALARKDDVVENGDAEESPRFGETARDVAVLGTRRRVA